MLPVVGDGKSIVCSHAVLPASQTDSWSTHSKSCCLHLSRTELYNRVEDGWDTNLEPCERAAVGSRPSVAGAMSLVLTAPHGYGEIGVSVTPATTAGAGVVVTVTSVERWAVETRIIAFGELWAGHLDNRTTSPIVMGKLQGPRSLSGFDGGGAPSSLPSAGYATLSRRGYYRYLLQAEVGDAVGFLFGPTGTIDAGWMALGVERGVSQPRPHRFASWCAGT